MIVLDTHTWVWWTIDPALLSGAQRQEIARNEDDRIGVSAISCWEVAKLIELERLELPVGLGEWFHAALRYPGVSLLELTPRSGPRVDHTAGRLPQRPRRPDNRGHSQGARLPPRHVRRQDRCLSACAVREIAEIPSCYDNEPHTPIPGRCQDRVATESPTSTFVHLCGLRKAAVIPAGSLLRTAWEGSGSGLGYRASASPKTDTAPAFLSAEAHADIVLPVVTTSSISSTRSPVASRVHWKASSMFCRRSSLPLIATCGGVSIDLRSRSSAIGISARRETSRASSCAWL